MLERVLERCRRYPYGFGIAREVTPADVGKRAAVRTVCSCDSCRPGPRFPDQQPGYARMVCGEIAAEVQEYRDWPWWPYLTPDDR